jgi:pyruvate dehydrogenase E2 component (dihydrolipoamide acetyltransferase)
MAAEFSMPQLGLTMTEGTILKWLKSVGETVALGDLLVEVETEKINYQVESTLEGVLLEILVPEGGIAPVKAPIAVIGASGERVQPPRDRSTTPAAAPAAEPAPLKGQQVPRPVTGGERLMASPIARRLARENHIELAAVTGTGPDGRVVERDILTYLEQSKVKASPVAVKIAEEFGVDLGMIHKESRIMKEDVIARLPLDTNAAPSTGRVNDVPISGMRKVIADRMSLSWQTAPHVNMTAEVDMSAASDLKEKLTQAFGVKISFTDIIVKCAAHALSEFDLVNSSLINGKIVRHDTINVGIAVALENGLIVPVIKNANHKPIKAVREEIAALSAKARSGGLAQDEISGGTFTVTNLGMFGVDHFTPIINQPESAILGVCRIVDRPVVHNAAVVVRPMMNLCLSFDHRLIDGAVGAQFLARVRQLMEQPLLLL